MKPSLLAALGLALMGSAFAAIDPALMALVPANSTMLAGIQVDQSQSSPFGQFLLSKAGNTGLEQFTAATGFLPQRDLKQVLLASAGDNSNSLILGRGIFQVDKLSTAAALAGGTKSTYSGIDLYTPANNPNGSVAFLNSSTVVIGEANMLHAAIDRYRAGTSTGNTLTTRANDLSNRYQAWFVTSSLERLNGLPAGGAIPPGAIQSIVQVAGGLQLGSNAVTIALEAATRTEKDAQALADVVRFFASMVQMNRNNDSNSARAASIVDAASITANGPLMQLSLAVPEKDLENMVNDQTSPSPRPANRKKAN